MPAQLSRYDIGIFAFNEGSDARTDGQSEHSNPYPSGSWSHNQWKHGWNSADKEWGKDARWPVRRLPEVRRCEA